ncbi:hypothetical protein FTUN_2340 [Frigoriglobus tundricola]|uniref:Protein kinase domain-containing protein n=1 Tax=Frigoriglobus tundricola TaxID=2774151 RepID=A0A6M5YNA2_9BACT|nr:hypothetical protein FTUN_2340 [Frigoriglobus tundricola]
MPGPSIPSDDDLHQFLLGALPEERVERVRAWLDAAPAHAERLAGLAAPDEFAARGGARPRAAAGGRGRARRPRRGRRAPGRGRGKRLSPNATPARGPRARSPVRTVGPRRAWGSTAWCVRSAAAAWVWFWRWPTTRSAAGRRPRCSTRTWSGNRTPSPGSCAKRARAAAVAHENVVPIWHFGTESGAPYIVMPLLKGESLDTHLKRAGALAAAEVVRIGREIAAGLGAAHAGGLVHRDMKPANVWLDEGTGRAIVLDFGLARLRDGTDALTESGALQGTPAFMAPEVLDGHPADARSDLFALGAILYQCATGRRAFPGATITAILKAVGTLDPDPPTAVNPLVPADLSALVMKLLAKNPAERVASAAAVGAALDALSAPRARGYTKTWIEPPAPKPRPVPRRPALVAAGVGLVALIAVGGWLGTRSRPTEVAQEPPKPEPAPVRYRGKVDVFVERVRDGKPRELRLDEPGALPLTANDRFRIRGEVDPPAYVYLVWVDPDHDVTAVYPWNPEADRWQGTRPATEEPTGKVRLPRDGWWRAPTAKPGVATMVLFARPTPLDVPDEVLERWFKELPELPLPPGGDGSAVWFDDYAAVTTDPARLRGFVRDETNDPFERWQGQLRKSLSGRAGFETAVSFARTGRK